MTVIHYITIACPFCGEVQTVASESTPDYLAKAACECGATCKMYVYRLSGRGLLTEWTLPEGFRLEAL